MFPRQRRDTIKDRAKQIPETNTIRRVIPGRFLWGCVWAEKNNAGRTFVCTSLVQAEFEIHVLPTYCDIVTVSGRVCI